MTSVGPEPGLGTWQLNGVVAVTVVSEALRMGYRVIDTASVYGNERDVGRALASSPIDLEAVTVITKVWPSDYDKVKAAVDASRSRLGLDVIGTVLLHWPVPQCFDRTVRAYIELVALQQRGWIRSVGVSNFLPGHVERLQRSARVTPEVNQVEMHPYLASMALASRSDRQALQAHSPFGGQRARGGAPVHHPEIRDITHAIGATPAQVVLAWLRQCGVTALPKSSSLDRLAENMASVDLDVDTDQVARIDALERGLRLGPDPCEVDEHAFG